MTPTLWLLLLAVLIVVATGFVVGLYDKPKSMISTGIMIFGCVLSASLYKGSTLPQPFGFLGYTIVAIVFWVLLFVGVILGDSLHRFLKPQTER